MSVRRMILRWLLKDIAGSVHVMTSSPASAIIGTSHTQTFAAGPNGEAIPQHTHTPPHVHHVTVPVKHIINRILGD